jgi:RNA-directed DNA polymerase
VRQLKALNIRDIRHLCFLLETDRHELDSIYQGIASDPDRYYRRGVILSKNGKERPIATPIGRFRRIVDRLNTLLQRLRFPDNMHGGLKGRSTRSYAKPHIRKQAILKSDLKDFFPSVRPGKVYDAFIKLGCSPDIAHYLTRLTTLDGGLPQGSPTSAVVGNLVCLNLAKRLEGLADSVDGFSGTYIDDIALSGPAYIGNFKPTALRIIQQEGFIQNLKKGKTAILGSDKEQVLTGIRVNNGFDAPSEKIREIRRLIDDLSQDIKSGKIINSKQITPLRSKIGYIGSLNPGAAKSLGRRLRKALKSDKPELGYTLYR